MCWLHQRVPSGYLTAPPRQLQDLGSYQKHPHCQWVSLGPGAVRNLRKLPGWAGLDRDILVPVCVSITEPHSLCSQR